MRKYYTFHPFCPNCLNSASNENNLIKEEYNIFTCLSCKNKFKSLINIDSNILFPLFSSIKQNVIELSYIDWILNEDISGKYFITWPWDSINFIPILLSEYLYEFREDKIIVFCDMNNLNPLFISDLNYQKSLETIVCIKDELDESNINKLNAKNIFVKGNVGFCRIFVNSLDIKNIKEFNKIVVSNFSKYNLSPVFFKLGEYNGIEFSCGFVDDEKTCFKDFLKKFKSFFGEKSIKFFKCGENFYNVSEKGFFELYFIETLDYMNQLQIDKNIEKSFFEVYNNKFNLIYPFSEIDYQFIFSKEDLINLKKLESKSILFINESILSKEVLNFISEYAPNLIISDIDGLFARKRFGSGHPIWRLFHFNCNMLFFSTNLNYRSTYNKYEEGRYIKNAGLTFHTWDHPEILMKLRKMDLMNYSLFSSSFYNVHGENDSLNIKFNISDELSEIDECYKIFRDLLKNKEVDKFIKNLIRTPIYIEGNYKARNRKLSWQYLLSIIFNLDEEKWEFMVNAFEKVYGWKSTPRNPLLNRLLEMIKANGWEEDEFVIIVYPSDIKRFKKLLNEIIGENEILVSSWADVNKDIENTPVKYGISTEFPIMDYNLFDSPLSEVTIVGSPMTIETFNQYKINRLTQNNIKPLYVLNKNDKAPDLLKTLLDEFDVDDIEMFNEIVNKSFESSTTSLNNNSHHRYNSNKIKQGTNAILVLDKQENSMILPFSKSISILKNHIDTLEISNAENCNELLGIDIIVNNPVNLIFFEFVLENDDNFKITDNTYVWESFFDLIKSMFEWINLLHDIVKKEELMSSKSIKDIKNNVVRGLKDFGVTVKTEYYIKKKWLSEPIELKLYNNDSIFIFEDVERTADEENTYKIYQWVSKNYEEFSVPLFNAGKSHAAAKKFQEIRSLFFNNDFRRLDDDLRKLNEKFQDFISNQFDETDLFNVKAYRIGKIKKDVKPFIILDDYNEFFEEN